MNPCTAGRNDLAVREIHEQSRAKARLALLLLGVCPGGAQHVPRHPEDVRRTHPREIAHIVAEHASQQTVEQHGGHAVDEKARNQPTPLPQRNSRAVMHRRRERAEICRSRRDGGDIAV